MNNYIMQLVEVVAGLAHFENVNAMYCEFEFVVVGYATEHDLYYDEDILLLIADEADILTLSLQLDPRFRFVLHEGGLNDI